jgi:hypothetical protein
MALCIVDAGGSGDFGAGEHIHLFGEVYVRYDGCHLDMKA